MIGSILVLSSCTISKGDGFAIYLTKGDIPPVQMEALSHVEIAGQPIISVEDIITYNAQTHELKLIDTAFERISELDVPVNVHHTPLPVQYDKIVINDTFRRIYGRCQDQTIAVGREIFSDLFEELPNLKLIHTLLGGGFFAIADFIAPKRSKVKEEMERLDLSAADKAGKHLHENIYFDISHAPPWGKAQLECAVKVMGADHLLFGCSYPVRKQWLVDGVDFINALDISQEEKDLILGKNARNLFKIR